MNKGYKGLYLKEMKKNEELEDYTTKLERKVKRLQLETCILLVMFGIELVIVCFGGGFR